MNKIFNYISIVTPILSILIFLYLVNSLFGGLFSEKECHTACTTTLYWLCFVLSVLSVFSSLKSKKFFIEKKLFIILPLSNLLILIILVTILGVGVLT
ncbi:MAG: hypothetical protein VX544_02320 [Pseudomonadota bacterium]|nr:hypothetical protein [Pseudomonadota bacterium]|tara:strand:+ start:10351 stop:10644 length:294 start_codon:yes stop_codon:yes gene_type:complete